MEPGIQGLYPKSCIFPTPGGCYRYGKTPAVCDKILVKNEIFKSKIQVPKSIFGPNVIILGMTGLENLFFNSTLAKKSKFVAKNRFVSPQIRILIEH